MKKFIKFSNFNKITIMLIILGLCIGIFASAQWNTKSVRISDPVISYASLEDTRNDLVTEQSALKSQIDDLQKKINEDQTILKKHSSNKNQVEEIEGYKAKIGLTDIVDKGVIIELDDSSMGSNDIEAITHAADLRDIVNFLWGNGVEAISINGERILFSTSIDCIVNTILINGTRTTPPFEIKATGNQSQVYDSSVNQNNLQDIYKRVKSEGLIFNVKQDNNISISAYNGGINIEYAKIFVQ